MPGKTKNPGNCSRFLLIRLESRLRNTGIFLTSMGVIGRAETDSLPAVAAVASLP